MIRTNKDRADQLRLMIQALPPPATGRIRHMFEALARELGPVSRRPIRLTAWEKALTGRKP